MLPCATRSEPNRSGLSLCSIELPLNLGLGFGCVLPLPPFWGQQD